MQTKLVHTVRDVERDVWNKILKGPLHSYEWFCYIEEQYKHDYIPYYFLFYEQDLLSFILPMFVPIIEFNTYNRIYWGRFQKFVKFLPGLQKKPLICFSPNPNTSTAGLFKFNKICKETLHEIIASIDEFSKSNSITEIVFMFILEENMQEIKILENHGYSKVYLASSGVLENSFHSFDDYLLSLTKKRRKVVRNEINKFSKCGANLEVIERPVDELETLHKLADNIQEKHNAGFHPYSAEKMKSVFENMKPYLTCIAAKAGDEIIGSLSILEKDGFMTTYGLGLDYEKARDNGMYFYMAYYNTIMEMIKRGINSIDFDIYAYKAKERRGCRLVPQYVVIKPLKHKLFFTIWQHVLNRQYKKKFLDSYNSNR
jgi:predicted N-acyltransferase